MVGGSKLCLEALSLTPQIAYSYTPHPTQDWPSQVERRDPGRMISWAPWDIWDMGLDLKCQGLDKTKQFSSCRPREPLLQSG